MNKKLMSCVMIAATAFASCTKTPEPCDPAKHDTHQSGNGIARGGCIPPPDETCEEIVCSAYLAEVSVNVTDGAGAPVHADSFVVTDAAGIVLPPAANGSPVYGYTKDNGNYTIVSDAWVSGHQNQTLIVHAKGFRKGATLFDEQYTIHADNCHVSKISGKDAITLAD